LLDQLYGFRGTKSGFYSGARTFSVATKETARKRKLARGPERDVIGGLASEVKVRTQSYAREKSFELTTSAFDRQVQQQPAGGRQVQLPSWRTTWEPATPTREPWREDVGFFSSPEPGREDTRGRRHEDETDSIKAGVAAWLGRRKKSAELLAQYTLARGLEPHRNGRNWHGEVEWQNVLSELEAYEEEKRMEAGNQGMRGLSRQTKAEILRQLKRSAREEETPRRRSVKRKPKKRTKARKDELEDDVSSFENLVSEGERSQTSDSAFRKRKKKVSRKRRHRSSSSSRSVPGKQKRKCSPASRSASSSSSSSRKKKGRKEKRKRDKVAPKEAHTPAVLLNKFQIDLV